MRMTSSASNASPARSGTARSIKWSAGRQVQDQDRAAFLDYLFSNYGPRPRGR